jgi:prepilin-type N-terminal cleavage/methylation domain-containing protein
MNKDFTSNNHRSAFTLVELAIVVVVLGILVSGILMGQSIIKSAKINGVVTEIKQMQTAIRAYQLEFDALPGDHKDAYDYFGDECGEDIEDSRRGCNGNGDKCLEIWGGVCHGPGSIFSADRRRLFVHLNLSGIIPDIPYQSNSHLIQQCKAGIAFPKSTMAGNTFVVGNPEKRSELVMTYLNDAGFVKDGGFCRMWGGGYPFTPAEAKSIDEKLDDGNGIKGKVKGLGHHYCRHEGGVYRVNQGDIKYCVISAVIN